MSKMKLLKSLLSVFALLLVLSPQVALAAAEIPPIQKPGHESRPAPLSVGPQALFFSACKLFPSEANCNLKDPGSEGCDADAYTLSSAEIPGVVRTAVRYSPSCGSVWARSVNLTTVAGRSITAQILRSDGSFSARSALYPTMATTSLMLFIGSNSARAFGTLQESNGYTVATVATGFVHP